MLTEVQRRGFLIDLEGTLLHQSQPAKGAFELLQRLQAAHQPCRLITDHHGSARELCIRLRRQGLFVDETRLFTSATAMARFLSRQQPGGTAYVIGNGGIASALERHGFAIDDREPDYVVVGEGNVLSMSVLQRAVTCVRAGAKLVATCLEPNVTTLDGVGPGSGAIVSALETATGRKALLLGRSSPASVCEAAHELGTHPRHTVLITDKMEPDVLTGLQLGLTTVLVLDGATAYSQLRNYAFKPSVMVRSIAALLEHEVLEASREASLGSRPEQAR